jgi:tetratricopeptide (TPR) repeat protein
MEVEQTAGDFEAAYEWGHRGCDLMETMGHLSWLSTMAAEVGNVLCELDRYDEAASWAERSRELGGADDIATQIYWREVLAKVAAQRGETEAAEQFAREALELANETDNINGQAEALLNLGRVLARAGRREHAEQALTEAVALFEQKGNVAMAGRTQEFL